MRPRLSRANKLDPTSNELRSGVDKMLRYPNEDTMRMRPKSVHEIRAVVHEMKAASCCLEIVDRPIIGV